MAPFSLATFYRQWILGILSVLSFPFQFDVPFLDDQNHERISQHHQESGWLPEWTAWGTGIVWWDPIPASLIADAYLKGNIPDVKDAEILLEAMLKNATIPDGRPVNSVGRAGVEYYNELGYVPYDVGIPENAARTLEYAYDDFALAQMAKNG